MRRIRNIECYPRLILSSPLSRHDDSDDNNAARNGTTKKRVRNHRILSYLRNRYGQGTWHMPSQGSWAKISGGGIPKGREFQQWPPLHTELSWLNFDISLSLSVFLGLPRIFPPCLFPFPTHGHFPGKHNGMSTACGSQMCGRGAFNLFLPQNDLWQCIEKFVLGCQQGRGNVNKGAEL